MAVKKSELYSTPTDRPLVVAEKEGISREGALEYIFIDDSGDTGLENTNTDQFILVAVVIGDEEVKMSLTEAINRFRRNLGWNELDEFKFAKTNKKIITELIESLQDINYCAYAVVFNKKEVSPICKTNGKNSLYTHVLKELLLRVGKNNQDIKVDGTSGKRNENELRKYLRQNLREKGVIDTNIRFVDSRKDPIIQLADIVAGAIARSYKDKPDAQKYLELLRSKIISIDEVYL